MDLSLPVSFDNLLHNNKCFMLTGNDECSDQTMDWNNRQSLRWTLLFYTSAKQTSGIIAVFWIRRWGWSFYKNIFKQISGRPHWIFKLLACHRTPPLNKLTYGALSKICECLIASDIQAWVRKLLVGRWVGELKRAKFWQKKNLVCRSYYLFRCVYQPKILNIAFVYFLYSKMILRSILLLSYLNL